MKSLLLSVITLITITFSSGAFADYCPTSGQINAESQLAMDNLEIVDEEVNYFYPQSSFMVIADINVIKAVLMSVNQMSDRSYNTCINIKSVFYTIDYSIFRLQRNMRAIMSQDRRSPLKPSWDVFLNSFMRLEGTIERSPGRYIFPRGRYRRSRSRVNRTRHHTRRHRTNPNRNSNRNPNRNPNVNP